MVTDPLSELDILVRSRYGIIVLDTPDEIRADSLLRQLSTRQSLPLYWWSRHAGLRRVGSNPAPVQGTEVPLGALRHIAQQGAEGMFVMPVTEPWLSEPGVASALVECARVLGQRRGAVVLLGEAIRLPPGLTREAATLALPTPDAGEYRELLRRLVRDLQPRMELAPDETERLLDGLAGLTTAEARRILTRVMLDDGRLSGKDLDQVIEAKRQSVMQESLLEYCDAEESLDDVAGLDNLKRWLDQRRVLLTEPERAAALGLPFPKGILLLGIPGCGKSLSAKAVAGAWMLPLLRLDSARLYNKYVGETERNLRRAIRAAERTAPTVLWIDEIEKAFSVDGSGDDGGLSLRLLGTFLSWLQERETRVFVVATANDIARLPMELIRKGRFDEIFFVDLPGEAERRAIFVLQLRRRAQDPTRFDPDRLVAATAGWTGAEIEQAVVAALYAALAARAPLSLELLLAEIGRTSPLSRTMPERIATLRAWARERAIPTG